MASLRNLVITILRLAGTASIAAALRYHAPPAPTQPLQTIMKVLADFAGALRLGRPRHRPLARMSGLARSLTASSNCMR